MTRTPEPARERALRELRERAAGCRACGLWREATQTVFGEGPPDAPIVLVGEQPGDREDLEGRPFVGPAGRLLDRALADAGIERSQVYLTNAVKHFKFKRRGKRRIHQRPDREEIAACRPWITAELELLEPEVVVCLGLVAAQALLGGSPKIERDRGHPLPSELAPVVLLTAHPSAALRQRDRESRHAAVAALTEDLRVAAQTLAHAR